MGEEYMRQIRKRMREKYPRVHKIISKSSDVAFHVGYWGACISILYVYMLQYTVRGPRSPID